MSQRPDWTSHHRLLPVIALGGMVGAVARYALVGWWPTPAGGFPWSTLVVNSSGCLLIGALMVLLVEGTGSHAVARSFVGVGILGGFTTFSTYAVQATALLQDGHPVTAVAYLLGTVVAALAAVLAGILLARTTLAARRRLFILRREST